MSVTGDSSIDVAPDDAGGAVSPSGLFARKSSGLVRELGVRDAFALNISAASPTALGFLVLVVLAGFPGTDLTWPLVITFIGSICLSLTYSQLLAAMPRSGADYVYTSRLLSPALGAAVGVAFFLVILVAALGTNIYEFASVYLPFLSQTLGQAFHSSGLTTFAGTLAEKGWTIGVSLVVCALAAYLLLRRLGVLARVTFYAIGVGIFAVVVLILEFFTHGQGTFRHAFDAHLHNPHAYQAVIAGAHHAGIATGVSTSAVLSSVALVWALYGGAQLANYTGGELRRPSKTFRASTLLAVGVIFLLLLLTWLAMKHTLGLAFAQSAAFLSQSDPTQYAKVAGDVTGYVPAYMGVIANPVSQVVVAVGFAFAILSTVFVMSAVLSRLVFALSFDRLLPAKLADVRGKSHAPIYAALFVTVLTFLATMLIVYTSVLQATRNFTLILEGVYVIASVGAAILPWRRRELYNAAPKVVGPKILGIPAITVIATINGIFWAVILYLGASKTQVNGGYDTRSVITLVGTCLLGFALYLAAWVGLRRKGISLGAATHELPPE